MIPINSTISITYEANMYELAMHYDRVILKMIQLESSKLNRYAAIIYNHWNHPYMQS